jgi:sec-independent protein translocase protein TatB
MFSNIGGLEVLFVMVVALIVLGPSKLPEAARQAGRFVNEVRRISSGFQKEFREAIQDPIIEAEARARGSIDNAKMAVNEPFTSMKATLDAPVEPAKAAASTDDTGPNNDTGPTDEVSGGDEVSGEPDDANPTDD